MSLDERTFQDYLKSAFDYLTAAFLLVLLSPVILVLSILIKVSGDGPVIFSQQRCGKDGRIFWLYKFRTMKAGSEDGLPLLSGKNDKRITRMGRFMRKHRLDEIPNFINVLKGEMSIVGPRPEQPYFSEMMLKIMPEYSIITRVRPGITSWGMVQYGYASNLEQLLERAEFDIEYVKNRSLWFDFRIIVNTIGIIVRGKGV